MLRRFAPLLVTFIPVTMPALSPSMETGTMEKWNVKVGDRVDPGMSFCSIQTDKASVSFDNALDEGYFAKMFAKEGDIVKVGNIIGLMVDEKADLGKAGEYKVPAELLGGDAAAAPVPAGTVAPAAASPPPPAVGGATLAGAELEAAIARSGPAVERIARECGIDQFQSIPATGKGGRFSKSDLVDLKPGAKAAASTHAKAAAAPTKTKSAAVGGDMWSVATQPSAVFDFKFKDDAILKQLCATMPIVPVPKPKEATATADKPTKK